MRLPLKPHPDTPCPAVTSIEVEIERAEGRALTLRYVLTGRIADLAIPAPAPSRRADELWRHTCFEAFLRPEAARPATPISSSTSPPRPSGRPIA